MFIFDVDDDEYDEVIAVVKYYSQSKDVYIISLPERTDEMSVPPEFLRVPTDADRAKAAQADAERRRARAGVAQTQQTQAYA